MDAQTIDKAKNSVFKPRWGEAAARILRVRSNAIGRRAPYEHHQWLPEVHLFDFEQ